jgi:hypothetical protein
MEGSWKRYELKTFIQMSCRKDTSIENKGVSETVILKYPLIVKI